MSEGDTTSYDLRAEYERLKRSDVAQGKRIADMIAAIRALATSDMPAGELRRSLLELIGEGP